MLKVLARFGTVGLEMGFAVGVGYLIGYLLDGLFGTKPWLALIFVLFGIAAGYKRLYDVAKKVRFNGLGRN